MATKNFDEFVIFHQILRQKCAIERKVCWNVLVR